MSQKTATEFNIVGAPSEEMKRRLLYLAQTDNGSVVTGLHSRDNSTTETRRSNELAEQMLMAAQVEAQIATKRLLNRLDELERANIEALHENEEALRTAREALDQMFADARRITMPDGTERIVLRDGDQVRFDDGTIADPEVIKVDQVSDNPHQWEVFSVKLSSVEKLETERDELLKFDTQIGEAREQIKSGLSVEALAALESKLDAATPPATQTINLRNSGNEPNSSSAAEPVPNQTVTLVNPAPALGPA